MEILEKFKIIEKRLSDNISKIFEENPDKLDGHQQISLVQKCYKVRNELENCGELKYKDLEYKMPQKRKRQKQINDIETEKIFVDFIDWYEIAPTCNSVIYDYVLENYPVSKYPKILCVGDGENSHLGRKLAMKGYKTISVDPLARDCFNDLPNFRAIQGTFDRDSKDMIDWADVIVGAKVSSLAEHLVDLPKPTIFNISKSKGRPKIPFKCSTIVKYDELREAIERSEKIEVVKVETKLGPYKYGESYIYVNNQREKEKCHTL